MNVCVKQGVVGGRKLGPQGSGTLRQQYTLLYSAILCYTLLYFVYVESTCAYWAHWHLLTIQQHLLSS